MMMIIESVKMIHTQTEVGRRVTVLLGLKEILI